ncbi:MAG TPA: histidine kinase N-terminal 7TM domain-containing protein [Clostridia bacterium]|nr:histidine kinase N-terminal 7TM domain-containing protein [Clostridia bacterium]
MFDYSFYYVFLILSCIITALLGLIALQRSVNRGAVAFACLMFGAALFSFCYIFKASSLSIYTAFFWLKLAYVGIVSIPVFWYIMIYQYTGAKSELSNRTVLKIILIPSITLLILFSNCCHGLYYTGMVLTRPEHISLIHVDKGPWYWVHIAYSYTLVICGYVRLIKEWLYSDKIYRSRLGIFLLSAIVPWFANILYHMRITPQGIDISPASYAVAGLVFAWGIYRYGVFELIPIARDNVFEAMQDGVVVFDLQNRVVDFNPEAESIMKDIAELEIGLTYGKVLESYFGISSAVALGLCEQREIKITVKNEMIYYNCVLSPITNKKKDVVGKTLILRNITDQIKLRERLKTYATLDGLTNIFNRRYFLELGRKALEGFESEEHSSAIVLFDIDLFKNINDAFGHEAGDNVLCSVAKVFANCLRSMDIFARYGGEEFVCLLPDTSSEAAIQIAERIRKNLASSSLDFHGNSLRITASFGVVGTDLVGKANLEELLKMADKALYDAKRRGRNCTCLFTWVG